MVLLKRILSSTIFKLIIAVIIGILLGLVVGESFMNVVVTVKYILGQLIFFMVPLIILAFISSSIAENERQSFPYVRLGIGIGLLFFRGGSFYGYVSGVLADSIIDC